jgi:nitrate reductase NapD
MMQPHRRHFIRGQWIGDSDRKSVHSGSEIASIIVQARPEWLDIVAESITSITGAEVVQRDSCGKLVVVLESADASIGNSLTQITLMPHVLSAALVFHAMDTN